MAYSIIFIKTLCATTKCIKSHSNLPDTGPISNFAKIFFMKTLSLAIFSTILCALFFACNNVDKSKMSSGAAPINDDTSKYTTIQWIDSVKDYGKITEGQKLDVAFRFKNTG